MRKELKERDDDLEEAQGLNNQIMAFLNKPRWRNESSEERPVGHEVAQFGAAEDAVLADGTTANMPQRISPEPKKSKTQRHLNSSSRARTSGRPSIATETPATSRKAVSFRPPFRELTAGTQTGIHPSPARKTPHKMEHEQKTHEDGCKENIEENLDSEMAEVSFCGSDLFTSTDQQLIADNHGMSPRNTSEDTTAEF